jgi:hypothetical protein
MNLFTYSAADELLVLRATIPVLLLIIAWFFGRSWYKRQVKTGEVCPKCGKTSFHRIHRTLLDRILGVSLPARRYRCDNLLCRWSGLRVYQHTSRHNHP